METSMASAAQATEALIQDYGRLVFHVLYGLTGNWEESEDLTQETFLRAFCRIDAARAASGAHFQAKAWLLKIAINLVRMQKRKQRAIRFFTFSELQPGQSTTECAGEIPTAAYEEIRDVGDLETVIAERDMVQHCMEQLPEALRIPLLLSVVGGFSSSEVARMLELSEAAVRQRLSRARKTFQRLYQEASGEHLFIGEPVAPLTKRIARLRSHPLHRPAALVLARAF